MKIVHVHWHIRRGAESEFLDWWGTNKPTDNPEFIDEVMYRREDEPELDVAEFLNVAMWTSHDAFRRQFPKAKEPRAFEARLRDRVFLSIKLEDA